MFHSIQEVLDLLSSKKGVMGVKGSRHEVLGSTSNSVTGSWRGFSLSSDGSEQSSEKSLEATVSSKALVLAIPNSRLMVPQQARSLT